LVPAVSQKRKNPPGKLRRIRITEAIRRRKALRYDVPRLGLTLGSTPLVRLELLLEVKIIAAREARV